VAVAESPDDADPRSGGLNTLAAARAIAVGGEVRVLTPAGFSGSAASVPDRRRVTSIPITFNAPVTGFSLASIRLKVNSRTVSLRGARLSGSGDTYTLVLHSRSTRLRGIYTLEIVGAGIFALQNGTPMTASSFIYWGNGRSVGVAAPASSPSTRAPVAGSAPKPVTTLRSVFPKTFTISRR